MAIETGGILPQKIDIAVPIEVPKVAALAAGETKRKRGVMQHRAGVAAGHGGDGLYVARETFRIMRHVSLPRVA